MRIRTKIKQLIVVPRQHPAVAFGAGVFAAIFAAACMVSATISHHRFVVPPTVGAIGRYLCSDHGGYNGVIPPFFKTGKYTFVCKNGFEIEDVLIDFVSEKSNESKTTDGVINSLAF